MKNNEIKNLCINSAKLYYKYLEENNKGRSVIKIYRISLVSGNDKFFKLELSRKLFDTDSIVFHYFLTKQEFDTTQIKIKEYDYDRNILIVKPTEDLPFTFDYINPNELEIICDLKFLVKNIEEFFKLNGNSINLPQKASNTKIKISDFSFLPNNLPNDSQKNALLNIFKYPFTYIWGAPGTGKTRYVLAYSIIQYINSGKKVAVFAPTNVALEQVLRGILEITDIAEINRNKILRIGNPSRKFAEDYPEVCEVAGIQKRIGEISKQIHIIENILGIDEVSQDAKSILTVTALSEDIDKIYNELSNLQKKCKSHNLLLKEIECNYKLLKQKTKTKNQAVLHNKKKLNSLTHKVIKFLTRKSTFRERQKDILDEELISLVIEEGIEKVKLKECKDNHTNMLDALTELSNILLNLKKKLHSISFKNKELEEIYAKLKYDNKFDNIGDLKHKWEEICETNVINNSLKEEYKIFSETQLKEKLQILIKQKRKILKYDTEERLKSIKLVGATLDGYISRFPDANLHAEHYFIDEAGYACIIKTLSVFLYNKPITLLGDHMQLPPVFELSSKKLNKENLDLYVWGQSAIYTEHLFSKAKLDCVHDYLNNIPFNPDYSIKADLNCTHRFGKNLAQILDKHIYNNGFTSNEDKGITTISFIHADKCLPRVKRDNLNEVLAIQQFLTHYHNSSFCILAPYNDQINLLKFKMPELYTEEKILTVHKSQGREWDIVILSVCDTNNMFFTDTIHQLTNGKNLINTAVSRAKKELIIVCDYYFWIKQEQQLIQSLLSIANQKD